MKRLKPIDDLRTAIDKRADPGCSRPRRPNNRFDLMCIPAHNFFPADPILAALQSLTRMVPNMARRHPQVLHIGFSKCASTYLRALFRAQPTIHMVFKSGFFTPFLSKEMDFTQYQSLFRDESGVINVESDEHLTLPGIHPELGIRTTTLGQFEQVADKIRAHLPDVKLLMVIRNQASLIVSRYSEYLITGGSLEFDDFADRLMDDGHGRNLHFQNYYSRIIDILESRFPRVNLLVLLQEAMRENSVRSVTVISDCLALDDFHEMKKGLRSERRSLSVAGMRILRPLNRLLVARSSVGGEPPTTRIPSSAYQFVVKVVRAIDFYFLGRFSHNSSSLLTAARRRAILSHFKADNMRLQERLGLNLRALGYLDDGGV